MLLSQYLLPIIKETPSEATVVSHQLMLRSGMIRQLSTGIYVWLPLGLRVLHKVQDIIRREMNKIGAVEVLLPMLQPAQLWAKSGRYQWGEDMMSETLKARDRHEVEMFFAPTAEEVMTHVFSETILSYKELPKNLYQISTKFRDEVRPRYGVLRSREFCMKDAYSFDIDEISAMKTYDNMLQTYIRIFRCFGILTTIPVVAGTGDIGGDLSHEFHVLANIGESKVYFDRAVLPVLSSNDFSMQSLSRFYAVEENKHNAEKCHVSQNDLIISSSIEVGQIFYLGDKYSKAMGVGIQTQGGTLTYPMMGCYGIGVSRVIAACIETNYDEYGIIWHPNIAPFTCMLINLKVGDPLCDNLGRKIYQVLQNAGFEVLYDDVNDSVGRKLASADLLGIPVQIIVGPRHVSDNLVELKDRRSMTIMGKYNEDNIVSALTAHIRLLISMRINGG